MMYSILELQDLFVDACVTDDTGRLIFCSFFGRDTALQQLFAAFTLPVHSGGIDKITLRDPERHQGEQDFVAQIFEGNRLEKISGRLPRENVFGNLSHTWIFDPVCTKPDRVNRKAWLLTALAPGEVLDPEHQRENVWQTVKMLSALPLLDVWREVVLERLNVSSSTQAFCRGSVAAIHVALPDTYESHIAELVASGHLKAFNDSPLGVNAYA
jgi:hypothetical protein